MQASPLQGRQASTNTMSPPYAPTTAALGGVSVKHVDIPITAVFLVLFIFGAVMHMTIFQINMKRGHKFVMSGMMFGFCMARITTAVLRIASTCYPTNIRLAIAAQVFVAAGVVLLFIVNLLFAQRILRAQHPRSGWHRVVHFAFLAIYVLIVVNLVMIIICTIQSFYTLNLNTRRIDRDIQLYGQTFYAIVAFLPIPICLLSLAFPRKTKTEKFGEGRFRNKIYILLAASTLLCLGATFRAGTNYKTPQPRNDPPRYYAKACFYVFNFVVEIIVIYLYILVRVDKRFWVPNNSHKAGDYLRAKSGSDMLLDKEKEADDLAKDKTRGRGKLEREIGTEEEDFDGMSPEEVAEEDMKKGNKKTGAGLDEEKAMGNGTPKPFSSATTAIATPEARTAIATPDNRLSTHEDGLQKPEAAHVTPTPAFDAAMEATDPEKKQEGAL